MNHSSVSCCKFFRLLNEQGRAENVLSLISRDSNNEQLPSLSGRFKIKFLLTSKILKLYRFSILEEIELSRFYEMVNS